MTTHDRDARIRLSWEANADAWTAAVRQGRIPSRRAGTDEAIIAQCAALLPGRVLDVGCGEGWLTRALAERGATAVGIDASQALIAQARAAGGASYDVVGYDALIADPALAAGPWDVIVCNFSLLGDPLAPTLRALGARLGAGGRLLIQTVHPWLARSGDDQYRDEWREESFDTFGEEFAATMPWYSRTLESWVAELARAGLHVSAISEPRHCETGRPLSVILTAVAAGSGL